MNDEALRAQGIESWGGISFAQVREGRTVAVYGQRPKSKRFDFPWRDILLGDFSGYILLAQGEVVEKTNIYFKLDTGISFFKADMEKRLNPLVVKIKRASTPESPYYS